MHALHLKLDTILGRCEAIEILLIELLTQGRKHMSETLTLEVLVTELNAATNEIAAHQDRLLKELAADAQNNLAPKPETIAALVGIRDRLMALGADPVTPIPGGASVAPAPAPVEPVTHFDAPPAPAHEEPVHVDVPPAAPTTPAV